MRWCWAKREFDDRRHRRPCGLMDKAPDFGSGDCRFESCHGRNIFLCFAEILIGLCSQEKRIMNYYILECIWFNTFLWKKNTWKDFLGLWPGGLVRFGTNLKLWIIWRRIFDTKGKSTKEMPAIPRSEVWCLIHSATRLRCVLYTSILFFLCQNIICFVMICQTKTTKLSMKEKCCTVVSILQTGKVLV